MNIKLRLLIVLLAVTTFFVFPMECTLANQTGLSYLDVAFLDETLTEIDYFSVQPESGENNFSYQYFASTEYITVKALANNPEDSVEIVFNGNVYYNNDDIDISEQSNFTLQINISGSLNVSYTLSLQRKIASSNANLSYLAYRVFALQDFIEVDLFAEELLIEVPKSSETIELIIFTEDDLATTVVQSSNETIVLESQYSSPISIPSLTEILLITVIAEDGTENEYTLQIIKAAAFSQNNSLSLIQVHAFDSSQSTISSESVNCDDRKTYSLNLPPNTSYFSLEAFPEDYTANIRYYIGTTEVNNDEIPANTSQVRIVVTSEDNEEMEYSINFGLQTPAYSSYGINTNILSFLAIGLFALGLLFTKREKAGITI